MSLRRIPYAFAKFVKVEYCMAWKYETDFDQLKDKIHQYDRSIYVKGIKTTISIINNITETGKFEVEYWKDEKIKPELIYSALQNGRITDQKIEELAGIILKWELLISKLKHENNEEFALNSEGQFLIFFDVMASY